MKLRIKPDHYSGQQVSKIESILKPRDLNFETKHTSRVGFGTLYKHQKLLSVASLSKNRFKTCSGNAGEGGKSINKNIDEWARRYLSGESLRDIVERVGVNYETVRKYLKMRGVPMRSLSEAISLAWAKRSPKKPFTGCGEEKACMTMFVVGDCSTWKFPSSVRVSANTSHQAQIGLFHNLFSKYSCVSKSPRFDKKRRTYDYGLSCTLDPDSFGFLYPKPSTVPMEIQENKNMLYRGLEGYADAEGSIYLYRGGAYAYASFVLHSSDYSVLEAFYKSFKNLDYDPCLNTKNSPKNFATLGFFAGNALPILRKLKFCHREKVEAKQLVLELHGEKWSKAKAEYVAFRNKLKKDARRCREYARRDYILHHGRPHPRDPNQSIPSDIKSLLNLHGQSRDYPSARDEDI